MHGGGEGKVQPTMHGGSKGVDDAQGCDSANEWGGETWGPRKLQLTLPTISNFMFLGGNKMFRIVASKDLMVKPDIPP